MNVKKDKPNVWKRIVVNVVDSQNGVKEIVRKNRALRSLGPFTLVVLLAIVLITRLVSGEWFCLLEWLIVAVELFLVLVTETLNFAIEILCDRVTDEYDAAIRRVKDVASAAVYFCWIPAILSTLFFAVCHFLHFEWYEGLT